VLAFAFVTGTVQHGVSLEALIALPAVSSDLGLWLGWLCVVGIGRVVLGCLPAGEPGGHTPRELAGTWAASYLLGLVATGAWAGLAGWIGMPRTALTLTSPWAILGVARVASLPGSLRPRHDVSRELPGLLAKALLVLLALATFLPALELVRGMDPAPSSTPQAPTPPLVAAHFALLESLGAGADGRAAMLLSASSLAAIVVMLSHALTQARRAPFGRRVVLLVFALTPFLQQQASSDGGELVIAMTFAAGCAFLVPWLRRADARAAALSAIAFAACPLAGADGWPLGIAGLAVLAAFTARAGLRVPLAWSLGALLVLDLPRQMASLGAAPATAFAEELSLRERASRALGSLASTVGRIELWGLGWWAALAACAIGLWWVIRKHNPLDRGERGPSAVDEPLREVRALLWVFALALLGRVLSASMHTGELAAFGERTALHLAPCAALLSGLVLARSERP
jgi:hypothetical protein